MRRAREILVRRDREQVFHVMSRVVDRRKVMGEEEKGQFLRILRSQELFSGCEILTYAIMGNHFHLLVKVPRKGERISDESILGRLVYLYGRDKSDEILYMLDQWRKLGHDQRIEEYIERLWRRMYDLSAFVKDVKQRFTRWYNDENDRKGTLWEERFKSVLVEGRMGCLRAVGAYIDLNPVKAGLVENASDYKWSGIGEASRGGKRARSGLMGLCIAGSGAGGWNEFYSSYASYLNSKKEHLLLASGEAADSSHATDERHGGAAGYRGEGKILGLRHFSDALVIGSSEFIDSLFLEMRGRAARDQPLSGVGWVGASRVPFPQYFKEGMMECGKRLRRILGQKGGAAGKF